MHSIWDNKQTVFLIFTFLVTTVGGSTQAVLLQYATKRYSWTWSQASYLIALHAIASLILLLLLLPLASCYLTSTLALPVERKDLCLVRASAMLFCVGSFVIGLSPTPVLMVIDRTVSALELGYPLLLRSLLTSLMRGHYIGTLYNAIGFAQTVGALVAGPLLATSLRLGLKLGKGWEGLPYTASGCLFLTAVVAVWIARLALNTNTDNNTRETEVQAGNTDEVED